jgi:multidrug efflux pump subunit AcrA (membrane-fusion protein)
MPKIISSTFASLPRFLKTKTAIGTLAVLVVVGGYFVFFHKAPTRTFVTVERGSITESVSLTGNTTPAQSVSLTFGSGGTISHTYSSLGKKVKVGQVLASLNTSDLAAGVRSAQANVDAQQAKLEGLQAGFTPRRYCGFPSIAR